MLRHFRICVAFASVAGLGLLAGCAETELASHGAKVATRGTTPHESASLPDGYKLGRPYEVSGVTYYPYHDPAFVEEGVASWYGAEFHGRKTASGEPYDMNAVTAAHKTLPMPSTVRVTNLSNGRTLLVRVNDRGPFVDDRVIDLSRRSAQLLGVYASGTAPVKVEFVELAALDPADTAVAIAANDGAISDAEPTAADDQEPEPVKLWSATDKSKDERMAAGAEPRATPKAAPRSAAVVMQEEVPAPKGKSALPGIVVSHEVDEPADAAAPIARPAAVTADKETAAAKRKPARPAVVVAREEAPVKEASAPPPPPKVRPKPSGGGLLISSANAAEIEESEIRPAAAAVPADIFVQVGAFASRDSANLLRTQLASLGRIFIEPAQANGRTIFRVRFGPMASHDAADSLLDRLLRSGYVTAKLIVASN